MKHLCILLVAQLEKFYKTRRQEFTLECFAANVQYFHGEEIYHDGIVREQQWDRRNSENCHMGLDENGCAFPSTILATT